MRLSSDRMHASRPRCRGGSDARVKVTPHHSPINTWKPNTIPGVERRRAHNESAAPARAAHGAVRRGTTGRSGLAGGLVGASLLWSTATHACIVEMEELTLEQAPPSA